MASTHHDSEATHDQTLVNSDSFADTLEQVVAHIETGCQDAVSNNMQPQKVIEGCSTHHMSAIKELLASMKASDGLTTGEGEVDINAFVHDVKMNREATREMLARMEEVSNVLKQVHTARLLFVDGVNNLANAGILETGFLAGIFGVLFVVAFMIGLACHLLSERQARIFGLGVLAVCLVIRFGGI